MASQKNTSSKSRFDLKVKKRKSPTAETLISGIFKGDKAALARAITLVESTKKENHNKANSIIEKCLSKNTDTIRIGITGVPGVGKSTFIEALGKVLTALGKKVAVLAVDPSSTQTKGSILGDKTRMQELVREPNAFIRPSPSGVSLGGVARKTRETIILCEAAGYNVILIETVGVGQSETAVHSMVDFFLLLKLPGAGDELQGIKRGIIEMADALVINKADGNHLQLAKVAATDFKRALQLYPPKENGWTPEVLSCSAIEQTGIHDIWDMILTYIEAAKKSNYFDKKRQQQNKNWLLQTLNDQLKLQFYQDERITNALKEILIAVEQNKISPFHAAEKLLSMYRQ